MSEKPIGEEARGPAAEPQVPGARLRLADFERHTLLRPLRIEDFDELVAMQSLCFPGMQTWKREQIESQLTVFPEGQMVIEHDGRVVASASSLVVDFEGYSEWHNWKEIADSGFIRNHDPEGDTLYGIEIMVHPDFRGLKLARRLYAARRELCRRLNLARSIIGGRIPGYGKYADQLSAPEYAEKVITRGLYDPVLTTQVANGFVLKRLIPDYFPGDKDSRGYATFLEWNNLEYVEESRHRLQRVSLVRICAVQYQMRLIHSFEEFAKQCEYFVDTASDSKSDFVLFPELFTTQLLTLVAAKYPAEAARALAEMTPRYLELFTDLAIRYNVNIIGGSQFALEEGELRNVSYLFRRDGTIGRQYKIHATPTERRWWGVRPGSKVELLDTDRGKIAILICYDIEFPELARIASSKGAQIVFVPFNTDSRQGYLRVRHCAQARCIENQLYVAISGCVGNLPFVENADVHYAQSGVFTPLDYSFARDGIAAECTPNIETLVVQDVDLEMLRRHKQAGTVQNWNDRRKDIYRLHYFDGRGGPEREI
ncbi:MAG TPA: GNAT family N-acetyltransferase [Planctomycetota bacterium]